MIPVSAIYLVDYYANNLDSAMHRASPKVKMASTVVALCAIISSTRLPVLVAQFLTIVAFQAASRLPIRRLMLWAVYPAFFAALFAVSQIEYSVELSAQTLLRAVDAALLMLLFINTTPFTRIIPIIGKVSKTVSNLAFFSYRFFFLFIDESARRLTALRVRGGFQGSIWSKVKNAANLIGLLFVSSIESGERVYDTIKTRGYRGRFSNEAANVRGVTRDDCAPALLAVLAVGIFLVGNLCGLP